jgi:hypothetical protein
MLKYKLKISLIVIGFIGFGIFFTVLFFSNMDFNLSKNIFIAVCLFMISIGAIVNGIVSLRK